MHCTIMERLMNCVDFLLLEMTHGAGLIDRDSDLYDTYVIHTEEWDEFASKVQE